MTQDGEAVEKKQYIMKSRSYILSVLFSILFFSCQKEEIEVESLKSFEIITLIKSAAWSNIIKLSNNDLLVFYQKAEDPQIPSQMKISVECVKSTDSGVSWGAPIKIFSIPIQQNDKGYNVYQIRNLAIGQSNSGRVILGFTVQNYEIDLLGKPVYDGISPASFKVEGLFTTYSDDNGITFSKPEKQVIINILEPTPHHKIINDNYGNLVMSVYGPTNRNWSKSCSSIYKSFDNGKSFYYISDIESRETLPFGETSLLKTGNEFQAYVRIDSNYVVQYFSEDNLFTWKRRRNVTDEFQVPAQPILLKSNKIVLFSGKRDLPYSVIARLSGDNGKTFTMPKTIVSLNSPNSGYPNAVETSNGIILTYYQMPMSNIYKELWINSGVYIIRFTEKELESL